MNQLLIFPVGLTMGFIPQLQFISPMSLLIFPREKNVLKASGGPLRPTSPKRLQLITIHNNKKNVKDKKKKSNLISSVK